MKCSFDPTEVPYNSLGMFHCPECGEMVLGMAPHPDYDEMNDPNWEGWAELEASNARQVIEKTILDDGPYTIIPNDGITQKVDSYGNFVFDGIDYF